MTRDTDDGGGDEWPGPTDTEATRSETGRRSFLQAMAGAGAGVGLVGLLSAGDVLSSDRGDVSIVYGYARSDPADPETTEALETTVPAEWYDQLESALEGHRRLPFADLAGVVGSSVVPGTYSDPRASLSIQAESADVREEVAGLLPDVDVEVDVVDEVLPFTDEPTTAAPRTVADLHERAVPAGVLCRNEGTYGSLAPALYDRSTGERFFATSNHLYRNARRDGPDAPLYLVNGSDLARIGQVRRRHPKQDLALIEPTGEHVPGIEISDAVPGTVAGQFTKVGLADLRARGEPLEMVGALSGHETGEIEAIDGTTFYAGAVPKTGQLKWGEESTLTDGDSGSVNYHRDPNDRDRVLVAGLNNARTWWPGADFAWGTAAYHIRNVRGYTF